MNLHQGNFMCLQLKIKTPKRRWWGFFNIKLRSLECVDMVQNNLYLHDVSNPRVIVAISVWAGGDWVCD